MRRTTQASLLAALLARCAVVGAAGPLIKASEGEPPRLPPLTSAAFVLVGAAYDLTEADLRLYATHVVGAFGANRHEAFAVVKGVHFDGGAYDASEMMALEAALRDEVGVAEGNLRLGAGAFGAVGDGYRNASAAISACAWPPGGRLYRGAAGRALLDRRIEAWWGALDVANALVAAREAVLGVSFDVIVISRPDVVFSAPMRHISTVDARYWYTAAAPPDAVWILGREAARAALTTWSTLKTCATGRNHQKCCGALAAENYYFSWFIPCHTTRQLWRTGLRVVVDGRIQGSVRLHRFLEGGGVEAVAQNLSAAAKDTAHTVLKREAYDASVHPQPGAGAGHELCGMWRRAKHPR
ncbi:hypothetical protein M885DRAFT_563563 [Pelagophyceae sp. CCMP2097]|nr:hypothetical protein M885DRAFT_563563 [Pelagophyceae sp. CCMP2097]